ncbi:30S ribosomal protein S13 [Candidatus Woesearchaeota archaeon]|nr:30S ribosomal protein S13 [Candidatus Woesearchaeota archaeon]
MEEKAQLRQLIRIADADLQGARPIYHALRKIKGVSYAFSNTICHVASLDRSRKVGALSPEEVKKVEEVIKNPLKYNVPLHLLNRRKDYDSGEDKHLSSTTLKLQKDFDIKRLRMIKSYRGFRHQYGLPVRGQRTKSNFRKGAALGVKKKKEAKKGRT